MQIGYEALPANGVKWEELNKSSLESFLFARFWQAGANLADRTVMEKLAIRNAEGIVPTIAGALAFHVHPQSINPCWGIRALMFRGREFQRDALLLRQHLTGSAHFIARLWARPNPNLKVNNQPATSN